MYDYSDSYPPSDIGPPPPEVCLLLRTHAEQLWLSREVVPVLRQLQTPGGLPEEQLGAALAYLEVTWLEASRLAVECDAAFAALGATRASADQALALQARRYHAAVRLLREAVSEHVRALIAAPSKVTRAGEHAGS